MNLHAFTMKPYFLCFSMHCLFILEKLFQCKIVLVSQEVQIFNVNITFLHHYVQYIYGNTDLNDYIVTSLTWDSFDIEFMGNAQSIFFLRVGIICTYVRFCSFLKYKKATRLPKAVLVLKIF